MECDGGFEFESVKNIYQEKEKLKEKLKKKAYGML